LGILTGGQYGTLKMILSGRYSTMEADGIRQEMTKEDMTGKKIQVLVCPKRTLRFRISQ